MARSSSVIDPDEPTGEDWIRLELQARGASAGSLSTITMWKKGSVIVVSATSADGIGGMGTTLELRVGRTADVGILMRERDSGLRSQLLRLGEAREVSYAWVLGVLYGSLPFEPLESLRMTGISDWTTEGRRIARHRDRREWDLRVESAGHPASTETVEGWLWDEVRFLDLRAVRALTRQLVPRRVDGQSMRGAFLHANSSDPIERLHLRWGDLSGVELVVGGQADLPRDHSVLTPFSELGLVRIEGSERSVSIVASDRTGALRASQRLMSFARALGDAPTLAAPGSGHDRRLVSPSQPLT